MSKCTVSEEETLLTAALSGDSESSAAVDLLRHRFAPLIEGLASRLSWDADSREELVQEGSLALVEALPLFDAKRGAQLGTFIYQRARSRMLHYRRVQWRTPSLLNANDQRHLRSLDEKPESAEGTLTFHDVVAVGGEPLWRKVFVIEVRGMVETALLKLAARQASALRLRFWEDLSPSEIAERLEVSRPRVSVLVQSGLSNLRNELGFSA